ncbi:MAG: carbohydrate kinase family protein [Bacteroidota bacterium]
MRSGILIGGNWIIDQVKMIDVFPEEEKLVNIFTESSSNGGSAYNIIMGLVRLKADFPLCGLGLVGDDPRGEQIIADCAALGIDTRQIRKAEGAYTSYTDVMTVKGTGRRTFFHQRGANALLDIPHFDFSGAKEKIFHLGYLLLLDKLDEVEADGTTRASKVFAAAKQQGYITSADIVSERSDRFKSIIPSSLPYIDYLFVNEFEAGMITGIETVLDGQISQGRCIEAAKKILEMGVKQWVLLHFPDGAIAIHQSGKTVFQPSIQLPAHKISGAVGAGDAFAAGVLMGVHNDWDMERSLVLGVCAAASSLFEATSSDGILPAEECMTLTQSYGFRGGS